MARQAARRCQLGAGPSPAAIPRGLPAPAAGRAAAPWDAPASRRLRSRPRKCACQGGAQAPVSQRQLACRGPRHRTAPIPAAHPPPLLTHQAHREGAEQVRPRLHSHGERLEGSRQGPGGFEAASRGPPEGGASPGREGQGAPPAALARPHADPWMCPPARSRLPSGPSTQTPPPCLAAARATGGAPRAHRRGGHAHGGPDAEALPGGAVVRGGRAGPPAAPRHAGGPV
jgi:hypothetical protein